MTFKELITKLAETKASDISLFMKEIDRATWIKAGVGFLIFILFMIFAVIPGWFGRAALKKQGSEIASQMKSFKILKDKKPVLEAQKKEIQELIDGFQKKVFTEPEIGLLLGKISKVAQDSQVELIASHPMDKAEEFPEPYDKKYKRFIYQISLEGSFHKIADFVSRLESYPQYFQIQSLMINPQIHSPEKSIAELKLMAVSLYDPTLNPTGPSKDQNA